MPSSHPRTPPPPLKHFQPCQCRGDVTPRHKRASSRTRDIRQGTDPSSPHIPCLPTRRMSLAASAATPARHSLTRCRSKAANSLRHTSAHVREPCAHCARVPRPLSTPACVAPPRIRPSRWPPSRASTLCRSSVTRRSVSAASVKGVNCAAPTTAVRRVRRTYGAYDGPEDDGPERELCPA